MHQGQRNYLCLVFVCSLKCYFEVYSLHCEPARKMDTILTHWGRVMHICVAKLTIIGSDNGLSPGWRQATICTKAGIVLIWPLGANFSEILIANSNIFIQENALENVVCETASILFGLKVLSVCVFIKVLFWGIFPALWTSMENGHHINTWVSM